MESRLSSRKRGAQPGNQNALKHGFYSRQFNTQDLQDLEMDGTPGMQSEIAMMRVVMRRVFEQAHAEAADLEAWALALSTLGLAANRVSHLLKTDRLLIGTQDEVSSALSEALTEVLKEMGL